MKKLVTFLALNIFFSISIFAQHFSFTEQNMPEVMIPPQLSITGYGKGITDAADIDGDGDIDIIALKEGQLNNHNLFSTFINDGSGSFTIGQTGDIGVIGSRKIKFCDVDNDGDQDFIYSFWNGSSSSCQIKVYQNDGLGNFSLFHTQNSTDCKFKLGDINNDGYKDIITNDNYYNIVIYLNNHQGSFNTQINTSIKMKYYDVIDYNNDNFIDIIGYESHTNVVTSYTGKVLLNNQNNTFTEQTLSDLSAIQSIKGIKVADLDNDSVNEIIVLSYKRIDVLSLDSNNNYIISYTDSDRNSIPTNFSPDLIYVKDIEHNGLKDIIVLNCGMTSAYINNGNYNFSKKYFTEFKSVDYSGSIAIGDFNNDQKEELFFSFDNYHHQNNNNRLFVYQNDRFLHTGTHYVPKTYSYNDGFDFVDIDGDNLKDLLMVGSVGGRYSLRIFKNNGNSFDPIPTELTSKNNNIGSNFLDVFDVDNDGDKDILFYNFLFINDGNGNFTNEQRGLDLNYHTRFVVDIDGDNDMDVLLDSNRKLFINDGNGYFSEVGYPSNISNYIDCFFEINNDGLPDLINSSGAVYVNNGNNTFTFTNTIIESYNGRIYRVIMDLNNDGYEDIIKANDGGDTAVYFNDGNGNFVEDPNNLTGYLLEKNYFNDDSLNFIEVIDFDGDGDLDIIGNNKSQRKKTIFLNINNSLYKLNDDYLNIDNGGVFYSLDYNGDGLYDMIESSSTDNKLHLKLNNGINTNNILKLHFEDMYVGYSNSNATVNFDEISNVYFNNFSNNTIRYYSSRNDAINQQNELPNNYSLTINSNQSIPFFARIDTSPTIIFDFNIAFRYIHIEVNSDYCDHFGDGTETIFLENLGNSSSYIQFKFYTSLADAQNDVNDVTQITLPVGTHSVWIKGVNTEYRNCYVIEEVPINIAPHCQGSYSEYQVQQIPYSSYVLPQPNPVTFNSDDRYSSAINIGFNFDFFRNQYHSLAIGSNGNISFSSSDFGQFDPWAINTAIPSANLPKNNIFGVFQDIYNNTQQSGVIGYSEIGTPPFRKFVAFYNDVPLYSCQSTTASTQIVLYETYNFIDVQVDERTPCNNWNNGNGILGIQNELGNDAYYPNGKNTGNWTADDEAWRFRPNYLFPDFQYIICDANVDGVENFDANYILSHYSSGSTGVAYSLHLTENDAINNLNPITGIFQNTSNAQTLYVRADNQGNVTTKRVLIAAIDCNADYDIDGVPTNFEDINTNGNYGDDDTDGDGIPDFMDDDDDGDMILTQYELVISRPSSGSSLTYADTDGDGIPNYLDNDDDGDGVLTIDEDYDGDGNPLNDDINNDGIPDYLQQSVANGIIQFSDSELSIYPNPTNNNVNIVFSKTVHNLKITVLNIEGRELIHTNYDNISRLSLNFPKEKGIYLIKIISDEGIAIRKIIKK